MSASEGRVKGSCLCKSVTIEAAASPEHYGACHCGMCRKWGGGPMLAVDCGTSVTLTGEEKISIFNSSDWAERAFCAQCGTHLFYRLKQSQQYIIPMGLIEGSESLPFGSQVFIDEKPDSYEFKNQTKTMTGAEVFAMFG